MLSEVQVVGNVVGEEVRKTNRIMVIGLFKERKWGT